jgi:hypothetical protein
MQTRQFPVNAPHVALIFRHHIRALFPSPCFAPRSRTLHSYASDFGPTDAHVLRRICGFMAPQGSKPPSEAFTNLTIMLQVRGWDVFIETNMEEKRKYTEHGPHCSLWLSLCIEVLKKKTFFVSSPLTPSTYSRVSCVIRLISFTCIAIHPLSLYHGVFVESPQSSGDFTGGELTIEYKPFNWAPNGQF